MPRYIENLASTTAQIDINNIVVDAINGNFIEIHVHAYAGNVSDAYWLFSKAGSSDSRCFVASTRIALDWIGGLAFAADFNFTKPPIDVDFVIRFEYVTSQWVCWLDGVEVEVSNTGGGVVEIGQLMSVFGSSSLLGRFYRLTVSNSGGAITHNWDADDAGSTGTTLIDTVGGNNGTLVGALTYQGTSGTPNTAPIANAGADGNIDTGQSTVLNGSASSDPDGDTLTYAWTFTSVPAGSAVAFVNATVENPTFTPDLDGVYVAQLIVNDGALDSPASTVTKTASTAAVTSTLNMAMTGVAVASTVVYDTTMTNTTTNVTRTEPISWTNEAASYTWPEAAGATVMYVVIIPSAEPDAGVQIGDTI